MCECLGFGMSVYEGWCVLGGGERDLEGQLLSLDGLLGFGAGRRLSWAGSPVARTPGEGCWQRGLDAQAMPPFPAEKIRRTGATPGNARAAGGDLAAGPPWGRWPGRFRAGLPRPGRLHPRHRTRHDLNRGINRSVDFPVLAAAAFSLRATESGQECPAHTSCRRPCIPQQRPSVHQASRQHHRVPVSAQTSGSILCGPGWPPDFSAPFTWGLERRFATGPFPRLVFG